MVWGCGALGVFALEGVERADRSMEIVTGDSGLLRITCQQQTYACRSEIDDQT
ncbi:hypothetical protein GCM10009665_79890 [Kitasatospora nipponensis]|uniref:Uncharacterized protein n=1 Tax=Kitasatospora nipponensis TaxID=258049 RepID=A0ABP4DX19_9ACTN